LGLEEEVAMTIPETVKDCLNRSAKGRRLVLGTASKDGTPNAVPVGIERFADDETVVLVDNYFLKTRENLAQNPTIALTCWDLEEKDGKLVTRDGYQLKGRVRVESQGPLYEKIRAEVQGINPNFPAKAIVVMKVDEIFDVKSGPNAGKKIS
jgi:predicted pyridoxine 5'-phosphate oxidase superfamily flavin-nucleotide-binding protein